MKGYQITDSQRGSTLYAVLMILAILTLLGITLIDMTVVDLKLSGGYKDYKKQLYLAESAALEGVQQLINADMSAGTINDIFWIHTLKTNGTAADNYPLSDKIWKKSKLSVAASPRAEVVYSAIEKHNLCVADLSGTSLHEYEVTGIYNPLTTRGKGRIIVKIGYRKRF